MSDLQTLRKKLEQYQSEHARDAMAAIDTIESAGYGCQSCARHQSDVRLLLRALKPFAHAHYRDVHPGRPAKEAGFFAPEDVEFAQKVFAEVQE